MNDGLTPKPPRDSYTYKTELVQPGDTNAHGTIFGGRVVSLMDIAAATAAIRHCRKPVVTASIDRVDFFYPIQKGMIVCLSAAVNYTAHTSLEVGVRVESEEPMTGERLHTASAYLTFVALDADRRPAPIPPLAPETAEEERRYREGERRRQERLRWREEEKRKRLTHP